MPASGAALRTNFKPDGVGSSAASCEHSSSNAAFFELLSVRRFCQSMDIDVFTNVEPSSLLCWQTSEHPRKSSRLHVTLAMTVLIQADLLLFAHTERSKEIMRNELGLSKEGLVEALHERGYSDVTLRQVTDWRSRHLLPTFDLEGISLGRAQGRKKS